MDLLQEIRDRIEMLPEANRIGCLDVLRHLEHCDRLLVQGRSRAPEYFNDIIYRTNQAFEGVLKEAYRTLEEKDPDAVTLHKVEGLFVKNSVLPPKVIGLMKNYRTEWRNPSVHDYKLRFGESEGILAIASVSAFFVMLLGIIRDKLSIKPAEDAVRTTIRTAVRPASDLRQSIVQVIKSVLPTIFFLPKSDRPDGQVELLFAQALASADETWKLAREPGVPTPGGAIVRIDMTVAKGNETVAIELKRVGKGKAGEYSRDRAIDQMRRFMRAANISKGILVRLPAPEQPIVDQEVSDRVVVLPPEERGGALLSIVEIGLRQDIERG